MLFPTEWTNKIHVPNHQPLMVPMIYGDVHGIHGWLKIGLFSPMMKTNKGHMMTNQCCFRDILLSNKQTHMETLEHMKNNHKLNIVKTHMKYKSMFESCFELHAAGFNRHMFDSLYSRISTAFAGQSPTNWCDLRPCIVSLFYHKFLTTDRTNFGDALVL